MSEPQQPPAEILESGRGAGLPPREPRPRRTGGRRRWVAGGLAVVAVGTAAAVAYGTWWYSSTGAQPAEALPASTIGYAALDLDPSGGQKIDALRTLKKLPVASDELGLGGDVGDVDVTSAVLDVVLRGTVCDLGADDLAWVGDRGAIAAVPSDDGPVAVAVLQVEDAAAAEDGVAELSDCAGNDLGVSVEGDWALVGWSQGDVDHVVAERERGTLAEDADFRTWTGRAGDPGVVSLYASPRAGAVLADEIGTGWFATTGSAAMTACPVPDVLTDPDADLTNKQVERALDEWDDCNEAAMADPEPVEAPPISEADQQLQDRLRSFEGAAATLRFDDGGVELETAGDLEAFGPTVYAGTGGADALRSLPSDTAVAVGLGVGDDWFTQLFTSVAPAWLVGGADVEEMTAELEEATGLQLPEDADLLAGRSLAFAVSGDADPGTMLGSPSPGDVPAGVKVLGDPTAIEEALGRVRAQVGDEAEGVLDSSTGDDALAVGPDAAYRDELLADGDLGDADGFDDVIEDADDASAALYVDLDAVGDWLPQLLLEDDDAAIAANVEPLSKLGGTTWDEDGVPHGLLRLTTD